jgi:hypothetical protein
MPRTIPQAARAGLACMAAAGTTINTVGQRQAAAGLQQLPCSSPGRIPYNALMQPAHTAAVDSTPEAAGRQCQTACLPQLPHTTPGNGNMLFAEAAVNDMTPTCSEPCASCCWPAAAAPQNTNKADHAVSACSSSSSWQHTRGRPPLERCCQLLAASAAADTRRQDSSVSPRSSSWQHTQSGWPGAKCCWLAEGATQDTWQ